MSMDDSQLVGTSRSLDGTSAWCAHRDRIATASVDPAWREEYVQALKLGVALEREADARWEGRVRCLYMHSEPGDVAIFFVGEDTLRDALLSLVPRSASLRVHYISLDAQRRRLQRGLARAAPRDHDGLGEAERRFINFLIEQALKRWTHGT